MALTVYRPRTYEGLISFSLIRQVSAADPFLGSTLMTDLMIDF